MGFYHYSIDDIFDSLIEVTDANVALFEHPFFSFLQSLNADYATSFDLYLFYQKNLQGRLRKLSEIPTRLKKDLISSPWLRFGPHALDYDTPPYTQSPTEQKQTFNAIYAEISRFTSLNNTSRWLRLHYFSEAYELAMYWQSKGVDTLLLTDKPVAAYCLPDQEREKLVSSGFVQYQGLNLRRSQERIENLVDEGISSSDLQTRLTSYLKKYGCLILFSHEMNMRVPQVQQITRECLYYATKRGLFSK